jgi:hypothetical protein
MQEILGGQREEKAVALMARTSVFSAPRYSCSLQREVISRLGIEGEGERTRRDTLGCTPRLRASRKRGGMDISACRGCMHRMKPFSNPMRHSSMLCAYCFGIPRGLYAALKCCTPRRSCLCAFRPSSLQTLSHQEFSGTTRASTFGRRV